MNVNDVAMIDKAVRIENRNNRMHNEAVQLYVKVPSLQKLDAPIQEVAFEYDSYNLRNGSPDGTTRGKAIATPFVGSKDYFELPPLGVFGSDRNVGSAEARLVGDLYVKTTAGTRYHVLPMGGGPLVIDRRLADGLQTKHDPGPVGWNPKPVNVGSIPKTADVPWPSAEGYLNPDADR